MAVVNVLDVQIIGGSAGLRNLTTIFYTENEVISLRENTGKLCLPYPPKPLDVLNRLKTRSNKIITPQAVACGVCFYL
ncbi:MAG: phage holin family protein [Prevotella sp.]|nr:phage holin family protein [Prevotella sp.]